MTRIYLARHGQTDGNLRKLICGQYPYQLTETGREQARCIRDALEDVPLTAVYASDLRRAVETAAPTAIAKGLPIRSDSRLREFDFGTVDGALIASKLPEWIHWRSRYGIFSPEGGESSAALHRRVAEAVTEIALANEGGTVLVALHYHALLAFHHYVTLGGAPATCSLKVHNACLSCYDFEDGRFSEVFFDSTDHLRSLTL